MNKSICIINNLCNQKSNTATEKYIKTKNHSLIKNVSTAHNFRSTKLKLAAA